MANAFRVTSATLRAKADELEGLNSQYRQQVVNLADKESSLDSMWAGDAREEFRSRFAIEKEKYDTFARGIDTYIEQLRSTAVLYDQAEAANAQTARTRTI